MSFRSTYPLSVKAAVYNFLILREGVEALQALPPPSLSGIRDFAEFAGVSYGAVRTTLSRESADGYVQAFKDIGGTTRYRLLDPKLVLAMVNSRQTVHEEGFLVAVFSFATDEHTERAIVRETLKNFGFKKLAQNVYINGRIDTTILKAAMSKLGLEDHLFLFPCSPNEDPLLVKRILELFQISQRTETLETFYRDLKSFLTEPGMSTRETAQRILYGGLVLWEQFTTTEPPLPPSCLPQEYCFSALHRFYQEFSAREFGSVYEYYQGVNKP